MALFEVFGKIGVDTSELDKGLKDSEGAVTDFGSKLDEGLEDSESAVTGFGSKFGSAMGNIAKVGVAAFTAITVASGAMIAGLTSAINETAEYGDKVDKMSQKMGISAEAYQEWDAILQHSGSSIDSLKTSMVTLAKTAEKGDEAFAKIGITQEQLSKMNQEELFSATIAGLQGIENQTERTALASKLLGRGASELGALLNTSAEDMEAMRQKVHELGGVMSDDAVKASARYQDSLQDMKTGFDGLKRGLVVDFLPAVTNVFDGISMLLTGNMDEGIDVINNGIQEFVETIKQKAPKVIETFKGVLKSLVTAIASMLPEILNIGADTIFVIFDAIIEMLPDIIENGVFTLVSILATNLVKMLPKLISAVTKTITALALTLTKPENITMLINAVIDIILAVINAIVDAIPQIAEVIPQIIFNLVEALIKNLPKIIVAAGEIVLGIIKGIVAYYAALGSVAKGIIDKIGEKIKEGINKAKEWGEELIGKLADGIIEKATALVESVKKIIGKIKNFFTGAKEDEANAKETLNGLEDDDDYSTPVASSGGGGSSFSGRGGGVTINQNIYSKAQTAADLQQEAVSSAKRATLARAG